MTRALVFVMFVVACGGGSGGGGTGQVTPDQASALCNQGCAHLVECGSSSTQAECVADCTGDTTAWRQDALRTLVECMDAQTCDQDVELCFLEIEPLPIHREWEDACRAQFAACVADPSELDFRCDVDGGPSEGTGFMRVIAPAIMEELIACLDMPDCLSRDSCVQSVAEANDINF